MSDVVVIGGGISGLACAWQIRRAGFDVVVLEAKRRPGGVIQSHRLDGYLVESGPNSILPTRATIEFLQEAGLMEEIVVAPLKSPRFIYVNGKLRRAPWVLSPAGTLRALAEPLMSRNRDQGDESLASFFRRRFGTEVHDRLVAPFVGGIYAGDTEELSIEATFPRMKELESLYGSVMLGVLRGALSRPRPKLSSFRRGMETLPRGLARNLDIRYGVDGTCLEPSWSVDSSAGQIQAKAVVVAAPADAVSALLTPIDPELGNVFRAVPYAPILVVAASVGEAQLRTPLDGFGFLVPRGESLHTLGTLFSSSLFPSRAPEGKALLTSFLGGATEPDIVRWSDERVWETVESELKQVLGFEGGVKQLALFRYPRAIPQYRLGQPRWKKDAMKRIAKQPGLFLAGNYLNGVSVPASIEQGQRTGSAVIEYLRRAS